MKCAAAVIRSCSVRYVRLSIQAVNQAGIVGFANVTLHVDRPWTVADPSTLAFVVTLPQLGSGARRGGFCKPRSHGPPGRTWSQRRLPITTAAAPPLIWYERLLGATIRHVVRIPPVGFERSDSR